MPQTSYKISEARRNFAQVLERAHQGEEIVIMRGNEVYARIGPADLGGKRPFGLLRQRGLPDDLFDAVDAEQAASPRHEAAARQPRRLLVDDRQRSAFGDRPITDRG